MMNTDDRIERARAAYQRAVFDGDTSALADAERGVDAVEADAALARGLILHARFQSVSAEPSSLPTEDPAELPLFKRALELYRALGDTRGEAEAMFWIGCLHQFIRRDNETALAYLERSCRLAEQTGDKPTWSEALRHLGIVAHTAGRLDEARELLQESCRPRREIGALRARHSQHSTRRTPLQALTVLTPSWTTSSRREHESEATATGGGWGFDALELAY